MKTTMITRAKTFLIILAASFFMMSCIGDVSRDNDYDPENPNNILNECGNNIEETGESCDDGNTNDGDGCSSICLLEGGTCGDGTHNAGEGCDDGNVATEICDYGDTSCTVCDEFCQSISGLTSYCGDLVKDVDNAEVCDDGNNVTETACQYGTAVCTACDSSCAAVLSLTGQFCGDGTCNGGETAATCTADCDTSGICGDSALNPGETCDDGNLTSGDGCSNSCQIEWGSNPVVHSITITGNPSGTGGQYLTGDEYTVSWDIRDPDGIMGYVILVAPAMDIQAFLASSTDGVPVYIDWALPPGGSGDNPFLPGNISNFTFTVPDAYGQEYYPMILAFDSNMNITSVLFDHTVSDTNMTLSFNLFNFDGPPPANVNYFVSNLPKVYMAIEPNSYTCGDGTTQLPEQCEDNNSTTGDGCDANCLFELPGDVCLAGHPLQSVSVSPTAINAASGEKSQITIQTDWRCTKEVEMTLTNADTGEQRELWDDFLNHTDVGEYTLYFPKNAYLTDGAWQITEIRIKDSSDNEYRYKPSAVVTNFFGYDYNWSNNYVNTMAATPSAINITGGTPDNTAPVITNIVVTGTASGANYQPGDVLTVQAMITDDISGIQYAYAEISDQNYENYGYCQLQPTATPNLYACDATLEGFSFTSGAVQVYARVGTQDNANNHIQYEYKDSVSTTYYSYYDEGASTDTATAIQIEFKNYDAPAPVIEANLFVGDPEAEIIFTDYDSVYLKFDATAGQAYQIFVNNKYNSAYTASAYINILDSSGNYIAGDINNYGSEKYLVAPETGLVYLRLNPNNMGNIGIRVVTATVDTTIPSLVSVDIMGTMSGGTYYMQGDTITVTAVVTDDIAGVHYVQINLRDKNTSNGMGWCFEGVNQTAPDTFECTITLNETGFPAGMVGVYAEVYTQDDAGNEAWYIYDSGVSTANYSVNSVDSLIALGEFLYELPMPATTPITVDGLEVVVTMSGDSQYLEFNAAAGQAYLINVNNMYNSANTGSAYISILDSNGNQLHWMDDTKTQGYFVSANAETIYLRLNTGKSGDIGISVATTTPDTTPPSISSVTLTGTPSGTNYQLGDIVTVTAVVTDDISGVDYVQINLRDKNTSNSIGWSDSGVTFIAPNSYRCTITLNDGGLPPGTINAFAEVYIQDGAGNQIWYGYDSSIPDNYSYWDGASYLNTGVALADFVYDIP
ncbi:MAG: DUF4215 domain-containing protein [Spirochaetia bacterium]|nr:DUF4215 domain-containing protein [Spirochaetia bacterium]